MVRSSSSTTMTFSSSPYFYDRGPHGIAQPITERINVGSISKKPHISEIISASLTSNCILLFPQRGRCPTLWSTFTQTVVHLLLKFAKERHPMKPHRLTLTNTLVMGYGLDKQIHNIYDPRPATQEELEMYHDHDYIDFLSRSAYSDINVMNSPNYDQRLE